MSAAQGGSNTMSMQSPSFGGSQPMSWAALDEQPFMDGYAGGQWVCGANRAWGYMEAGQDQYCTSCPPCVGNRFQTRLAIRDAGPSCCTTETYSYGTSWPYEFAGGSNCPRGPEEPQFQELTEVRHYPRQDIPIKMPFNPFYL